MDYGRVWVTGRISKGIRSRLYLVEIIFYYYMIPISGRQTPVQVVDACQPVQIIPPQAVFKTQQCFDNRANVFIHSNNFENGRSNHQKRFFTD